MVKAVNDKELSGGESGKRAPKLSGLSKLTIFFAAVTVIAFLVAISG